MKTNEIRKRFLKYFEQNNHVVYPSDSLIPGNDPTLLFTGAGMNQFKDMFLGKGTLGFKRATTCQKCLRTGDIENVGKTSSHHTFFEMLGNFSFGDYFKKEAIAWAWEFVRDELKLPEKKLCVSVYKDDNESFEIWNKKIGIHGSKIYRFGEENNFWPSSAPSKGPNGPCGPCTEIFYDQGEDIGCRRMECDPGCSCDRYVEIWNLVLMQFERKEGGRLDPLRNKCIDTGMGLERISRVMQGVYSNFDIDIFVPIIENISELARMHYDRNSKDSIPFDKLRTRLIRRIADHMRAVVFCTADGVFFSNEGRGYVERRLLRRAMRDVMELGIHDVLLYKLVPVIADVMEEPYPEVKKRRENIARIIKNEEERFHETLEKGTQLLDGYVDRLKKEGKTTLPGEDAFRLYDTYGFPIDMTEGILSEKGFSVDKIGFESELERQRDRARLGSQMTGEVFASMDTANTLHDSQFTIHGSVFKGYETIKTEHSKVILILHNGEAVDSAEKGQEVSIILDNTPFYAEAGGQIGDQGALSNADCNVEIYDTKMIGGNILHLSKVVKGKINKADTVIAEVNASRRDAIRRNHTATHILHHVLRQVIGQHAEQAGSMVANDRLRFDFRHFSGVTRDELERIEYLVNEKILNDDQVITEETTFKEARVSGAIALFGEKYGEIVRMVNVGGYSKELCGGTHVSRTGEIGMFRIISESSVASGIRRIEAITGLEALKRVKKYENITMELCNLLNTTEDLLAMRVGERLKEIKDLDKEVLRLKQKGMAEITARLIEHAREISATKVVAERLEDVTMADLRNIVDSLGRTTNSIAVVLGASENGNVILVAALSNDLVKQGLHAGKIVKEAAKIVGGGGGGRPEMAQAGGKFADKLDEAISHAFKLIKQELKGAETDG